MEQHMQQLSAQGVNNVDAIINRMMGYVPDLQVIWNGTSDEQLIMLSNEFPGFYRYALAMEEAFEAERNKASRSYDGMEQFSEQHKQMAAPLLTTAATLERDYQAFIGGGKLEMFRLQVAEMDKAYRKWLTDMESFKNSLRAAGTDAKAMEYVSEAFGRFADRIEKLAMLAA
jgi:hypothetical protein